MGEGNSPFPLSPGLFVPRMVINLTWVHSVQGRTPALINSRHLHIKEKPASSCR